MSRPASLPEWLCCISEWRHGVSEKADRVKPMRRAPRGGGHNGAVIREIQMNVKAAAAVSVAVWLACANVAAADNLAAKTAAKPAVKAPAKASAAPGAASAPDAPVVAATAASAPVIPAEVADELNRALKNNVAPRFAVQPDDVLDADTRAAALAMQAEHLPRVRALLDRWMREEMQRPNPQWASRRVWSRLANEFALWGRDSTGPAQDAALTQALQMPGMCRPVGNKSSDLVLRLSWLRGLPPEVRQQAVQAERELLARWGQPRQLNGAEPLAAEETLLQLRATGLAPKKPLPPVLAYFYLGEVEDKRRDPLVMDRFARCALHQWAGADAAQFRAAMAIQAADMVLVTRRQASNPAADDDPYPYLANVFGARGVITLQGDVTPEGRLVRPKIVKRDVSVPGIRDVRPYAFETSLDLATLAKAGEMDWSAAAPKAGVKTVQREFQWSLKWE